MSNEPNDVLLPCPFCASTDVKIVTDDGVHFAQCRKCEATGPTGFKRGDEDDADWNSRAQLAPLQAELERLKDNVREVTTYRDNAIKKIERLRNELTGTEKERDQLKAEAETLSETAMAQESMIEQLKEESFEGLYNAALDERDQLEARCDELEGLLARIRNSRGSCRVDYFFDIIDAALSKPAGSDQV